MAYAAIAMKASEEHEIERIKQFSAYQFKVEGACSFGYIFRAYYKKRSLADDSAADESARGLAREFFDIKKDYKKTVRHSVILAVYQSIEEDKVRISSDESDDDESPAEGHGTMTY